LFRRYSIIDVERKRDLLIEVLNKEKEAEISKSKMAFFTTISHEIRTPLTLIYNPLEQIIEKGDLSEQNKEKLELVNRNVNRLWILINQFLDFRKIDTGHVKMNVANCQLVNIIDSIGKAFKQQAEIQQIDFQIQYENANITGWVDEDKLTTILYNLISNAFKYVSDIKKVSVIINKIHMDEVADNDWKKSIISKDKSLHEVIEIKVIDSGIGIEKENFEVIFDRFHQVQNSTNKAGSSGIGLNIVKEYVKMYQGNISVESTMGEGSCFTIHILDDQKQYRTEELK
jgi:signal transduction histidine kinase